MPTTTTSGGSSGDGADDRVMATAQQIVRSMNTSKNAREDMLMILSSFDNRFSNLTELIGDEASSVQSRIDASEGVILRLEESSSSGGGPLTLFDDSPEEAAEYLAAVDEILDLLDNVSDSEAAERAETVVQIAMARLEEEFRHALIRSTVPLDADQLYGSIRRFSLSFPEGIAEEEEEEEEERFDSFAEESESPWFHKRGASLDADLFVELISPNAVPELKNLADRMVRAGYEEECVHVYSSVRRDALDECLLILGVEKLSIEEVQKIEWQALDDKMKKWIQAVKIGVRVLLTGEKRLCDQVFSSSDSAREVCFNETGKWCLMPLLNFGEAVAIGKRSSEKLFRILDMYDALAGVLSDLQLMVTDDFLCSEAEGVLDRLGDAARGTFTEFENNVKNETSKKPMLGGEIHPLTRYVMNYIKLVVDYSETLNSLLDCREEERSGGSQNGDTEAGQEETVTPLARRLLALLSILESNLEDKSRLYDDGAMQYVFLMNNILYMVQKVKDSELIKILGDQWVRKHQGKIRQYATAYLRAAWSKALSCLKDEGVGGSSNNASKVALKERFKNFNACFEELYRVQTGWKVPDPQLREELRISISEKVIPAYRAFVGRFGSQLDGGRHAGKYVKYTADDLENYLSDLFEGTSVVLHHLRRKSI